MQEWKRVVAMSEGIYKPESVHIGHEALLKLLASTIGMYDKEAEGIVFGVTEGENVYVSDIFPLQMDKMGGGYFAHANTSKMGRVVDTFCLADESLSIIGGYHSHPYNSRLPYCSYLGMDDKEVRRDDFAYINDKMIEHGYEPMKGWLELLVSVSFRRRKNMKYELIDYPRKKKISLPFSRKREYDLTLSAWWLYSSDWENGKVYAKELEIYLPGGLKEKFKEKT